MSSAFAEAALIKQNVTYLDIVAAGVLIYDYILTFTDELEYIWSSPRSIGNLLFILTRYPVFEETTLVLYHQFAVLSPSQCDTIYKAIGYQLGIGILAAECILARRTWAIWAQSRTIGGVLIAALITFWIPMFYFLSQSLNSLVFTMAPDPSLPGCFLASQKNILFVVFILITSFETLVLILTLTSFIPFYREKKTQLIQVLFRDGIMNYVYLCALSVCNVVVLLTAPHGYSTLLSALQRVLHSVLSARVLLNLRKAAAQSVIVDPCLPSTILSAGTVEDRTLGDIQFSESEEYAGSSDIELNRLSAVRVLVR